MSPPPHILLLPLALPNTLACIRFIPQVYMNGHLGNPVCSDVVKDGNKVATLGGVALSAAPMNEDAMERWLILNGPLSVALDSVGMEHYSGGIDMGEVESK